MMIWYNHMRKHLLHSPPNTSIHEQPIQYPTASCWFSQSPARSLSISLFLTLPSPIYSFFISPSIQVSHQTRVSRASSVDAMNCNPVKLCAGPMKINVWPCASVIRLISAVATATSHHQQFYSLRLSLPMSSRSVVHIYRNTPSQFAMHIQWPQTAAARERPLLLLSWRETTDRPTYQRCHSTPLEQQQQKARRQSQCAGRSCGPHHRPILLAYTVDDSVTLQIFALLFQESPKSEVRCHCLMF